VTVSGADSHAVPRTGPPLTPIGAPGPGANSVIGSMVKIVVAGGFGVGKTTLVASVSDLPPVTTEVVMTNASRALDDVTMAPGKQATTVAMDFGRITIDTSLVLYLFGTPGQKRFWFMWDDLVRGAIGAVVLVDVRRLRDCFGAIDYFDKARIPYAVVVNKFDGAPTHTREDLREALAVEAHVPILSCDARKRPGAKQALVAVAAHALATHRGAMGQARHPQQPYSPQ